MKRISSEYGSNEVIIYFRMNREKMDCFITDPDPPPPIQMFRTEVVVLVMK